MLKGSPEYEHLSDGQRCGCQQVDSASQVGRAGLSSTAFPAGMLSRNAQLVRAKVAGRNKRTPPGMAGRQQFCMDL